MRKLSAWFFALTLAMASCTQVLEEIKDELKDGKDEKGDFTEIEFEEVGSIILEANGEAGGAAEITAYDPRTMRLFVVNNAGDQSSVDVVNLEDPASPMLIASIDITPYGEGVSSVAVSKGLLAAAVEADGVDTPGSVVFFDTEDLSEVEVVTAGALPDMVTFSPNGRFALVANEGEPSDDYSIDPEGSVSIIQIRPRFEVTTLSFSGFDNMQSSLEEAGLRIFGPDATLAQDLEPEYIAVSDNSLTAWVSLQENNGIARIDLESKTITDIFPLGFKDYSLAENAIDVSDEDGEIMLANWPALGMYQPDAIAAYKVMGTNYIITANEGDSRDYDGFSEEERVEDLMLDPTAFPDADELQKEAEMGRLKITTTLGDTDGDGDYDELYSYGARSFSIWDGNTGMQVFDSGNEVEKIIMDAGLYDDGRSDDKGVEPEGVTVGKIGERTLAFVGLERVDAVVVYDVTDPYAPRFMQLLESGDAPEGLIFIPAKESPNGKNLFIVSSEGDGQVLIFEN